jgi:hypothetical protein
MLGAADEPDAQPPGVPTGGRERPGAVPRDAGLGVDVQAVLGEQQERLAQVVAGDQR